MPLPPTTTKPTTTATVTMVVPHKPRHHQTIDDDEHIPRAVPIRHDERPPPLTNGYNHPRMPTTAHQQLQLPTNNYNRPQTNDDRPTSPPPLTDNIDPTLMDNDPTHPRTAISHG
ncbi:hypothetical protein K443DRAFT_11661 [Laccaria amethystina LaAM-08-1]|uniref:Uncharacterized protein n=1 Tax=Laccaria amethystina LaAM-08-1 TaxID=1095629 RepID=A0A0C9WJP4_9AGAR|nr:hypothetical protein K443DRAFT_11661 [Laccaria amethystina LaAM-08-1]